MTQSSLMAWLNKPATVKEPPRNDQIKQNSALQRPPKSDGNPPSEGNEVKKMLHTTSESNDFIDVSKLPPNVELRSCTKDDIPALKRLIGLILPVPYPDKFYREIVEDDVTNNITLLAFWNDKIETSSPRITKEKGRLVGAIRCRLLAHPPTSATTRIAEKDQAPMLYLSALVLLSPYRRHGIATQMLNVLTRRAVDDYGVGSIGAHVWEANAEGLEWYGRRGFVEVGRQQDYYRRLKPTGALVLKRDVSVMDFVTNSMKKR
ncbi:Hypothetical protein R9X50_00051200 [Acrodontium crateriforme]|uniref:N-acetyltransferase domain-containing protein n=1 Tax=Acrodontium crateriforme TaxID=150365 RepID=A0AAQ3LXD6_9PEZI|nr:Hypothetical protein R9X50_00051200 [Acrodontium crateriforme]